MYLPLESPNEPNMYLFYRNNFLLSGHESYTYHSHLEDMAMKKTIILFVTLLSLGGFAGTGFAAEQGQIVIEDLSLSELNEQIDIVQKEFYRVFNTMNDDDDYDIICHRYTPTGTNISQEACEPQFLIDKRAENAREWQFGNDVLMEQDELLASVQPQFGELTDRMNAVAAESEYFRELNQVLGMLNDRLAEITN